MSGQTYCRMHLPDPADLSDDTLRRAQTASCALLSEYSTMDLEAAAADVTRHGLVHELGALRMILNRLLKEEPHLAQLAISASRIADVTARIARAQHDLTPQAAATIQASIGEIMDEVIAARSGTARKDLP